MPNPATGLHVYHMVVQIIAVHADDPEYKHITDISQLPRHRSLEIRRFFEDYKKNEHKRVEVDEMQGAAHARASVVRAAQYYEAEYVPKAEHVFDHSAASPRQQRQSETAQ